METNSDENTDDSLVRRYILGSNTETNIPIKPDCAEDWRDNADISPDKEMDIDEDAGSSTPFSISSMNKAQHLPYFKNSMNQYKTNDS